MRLPQNKLGLIKHGFTLIEMMLVILVVALISVYAVQLINQSMLRAQINRATVQIQSIKQASIAYYINNTRTWPSNLQQLTDKLYLPTNGVCSPFGSSTSKAPCGNYAQYTTTPPVPYVTYLQLTVTTPSPALAQQLVAATPSSWITNNTTVNIAVTPPADIATQRNHGWIVSAGVILTYANTSGRTASNSNGQTPNQANSTRVYLPNKCPWPYEGHILFFPEVYETNASGTDWTIHIAQMESNSSSESNDSSTITNGAANSIVFDTTASAKHGKNIYATTMADDPGNGVLSNATQSHLTTFMTVCLPGPDVENSSLSHWATFKINSNYQQDGQCSTGATSDSWKNYNTNTFACNVEDPANTTPPAGYSPVGSPYAY